MLIVSLLVFFPTPTFRFSFFRTQIELHMSVPFELIRKGGEKAYSLKELRHGLCILKKISLNFSSSSFAIRVNLRHP